MIVRLLLLLLLGFIPVGVAGPIVIGGPRIPAAGGGAAAAIVQCATQTARYNNAATFATETVTLNGVVSGNTIVVFVTHSNDSALTGVSDGSAFTPVFGELDDSVVNEQMGSAWIHSNVGSGTHNIVATAAAANVAWWGMRACEIGNVAVASGDGGAGQVQTAPGVGANALNSTAIVTVADGDLILGWFQSTGGSGSPTVGTGFTSFAADATMTDRIEYLTQSVAGSIASTANAFADEPHFSIIVAVKKL